MSSSPIPSEDLDLIERSTVDLKNAVEVVSLQGMPNKCPHCGAFRLDGKPPQIHKDDCPRHPYAHLK
jgi:hypothetical protein